MEMVVDTTLHINDKVRIHGQFTVLERNWNGNVQGNGEIANDGGDYRGSNDFWWERLYMSFPLFGGTIYVGRMGGGGWAYPFQDWEDNRDRIKYVRKIGHITVLGVIEKLVEGDGSTRLTDRPTVNDGFDTSHGDINSYAVGAIVPFSKNIIWKPLFYYIDRQNTASVADTTYAAANAAADAVVTATAAQARAAAVNAVYNSPATAAALAAATRNLATANAAMAAAAANQASAAGFGNADGYSAILMNAFTIKAGPFKLDTEINYRWTDQKNVFLNPRTRLAEDWDEGQWSWWADAGVTFGPAEIAFGGFFLEGTDSANPWENQSLWGIGAEFQPLLLLTSEDCGVLFESTGVRNGAPGTGRSGFQAFYLRAGYKISDSMKLSAILGYVKADEMLAGTHWDQVNRPGKAADKEIGWEFDIGFEWKFMPNLKYVAEFGYLDAGDYWSTAGAAVGFANAAGVDVANDVWGMRHMLVIEW
jgi:hypothetical protein